MGACQATPMQPRPFSSPGVLALLPARRAAPTGDREVRVKGVTYYSVDLGRVQRGGRDNDADRDVTVIPVIPGRRAHQGRCGGAAHHQTDPTRRRKVPARRRCRPRCRHARSPVPVAHGALLPLVGSLSSSRVTSSSCARPFLSVAGASRGVRRHQFQSRTAVPSGSQGPFGRAAVTGSRCAAVRLARGERGGHQVQLRIAYLLWEPPGDGPEGPHASPPLRVVR